VSNSGSYFIAQFGSLDNVRHLYAPAPSWIPDLLLANNFKHNVITEGVALPGCSGSYCAVLPVAVFPTSLYEAITCLLLFFFIWGLRKKIKYPLHLFSLYLILNGVERFLIEKIRVNYKYDWGFIHPTQAEIFSTVLIFLGAGIILFYKPNSDYVNDD
jgi:phosphatidylglycerol:prolipoprotein diacylglycerol transferase